VSQTWEHLLFAHWPVSPAALRPLVPEPLELDTLEGAAWVGVVPFLMSGVRARLLPPVPGASEFPELNVRTYVRHAGVSGVFFFSLDATSSLVVATARALWGLPYYRAAMELRLAPGGDGDEPAVVTESRRTHRGAPPAEYRARYRPTGPAFRAEPGTLPFWLTERYSLFVVDGARPGEGGDRDDRRRVRRGDIDHLPWELQPAEAEIEVDTMAAAAGIALPDEPPLLHFSRRQVTRAWLPRPSVAGLAGDAGPS
jgi:uncharacterized protein YqjF (DUF2071 family)